MIFRIGNIALYRNQYLCRIEDNDRSRIPYLVQFLGNDRPDQACAVRNTWCVWCRSEDLSPVEDVEPLTADINLSEVL